MRKLVCVQKKAAAAEEATAEPNGVAEAGPSEAAPAATNGKPEAGEKKKKKKKRSAEEAVAAIADAAETAEPVKKKKKKEAAEVNGVAAPTSEKKVRNADNTKSPGACCKVFGKRTHAFNDLRPTRDTLFGYCRRRRRLRWRVSDPHDRDAAHFEKVATCKCVFDSRSVVAMT